MRALRPVRIALTAGLLALALAGDRPAGAEEARSGKQGLVGRAQGYLATLTPAQRQVGVLPFEHPNRRVWTFLPGRRLGLSLRELKPAQRPVALEMVKAVLSEKGWAKVQGIFTLEAVLQEGLSAARRRRDSSWRDPLGYYVTLFGTPAAKGTWGLRVGGHHLSLNVTVVDGRARCAPFFFGANPARVTRGPRKGFAPLADQEREARTLAASFTDAQRKKGVLSSRVPGGIFLGPGRAMRDAKPAGLSLMDLRESQIAQFWKIVATYADMLEPTARAHVLTKAEQSDPRQVYFTWMGSIESGRDHYYRIRGPSFAIEYHNRGNHIHSVWRDATDFSAR
ncbi:MAG: DUF3500 domain-containing protein [Planctomycetota bacterium]|nr:DUF3500 domain-containing protein [Planctomycetota bacterium]